MKKSHFPAPLKPARGFRWKRTQRQSAWREVKPFSSCWLLPRSLRPLLKLAASYGIEIPFQPDGCIRCHLCERVCREIVGADALKMVKREGRKYIVPVEGACIGCGTCANICPTQAIRIEDKETVRTISIRDEIIGMHPLERCEGCGKRFATPKFLEYIHHRTLHHPDVKEHHQYCPSCAKLFLKGKQPMPSR